MADPSGEVTVSPEYIVEEKNAESCTSCLDTFNALFEADSTLSSYTSEDFGESATSANLDLLATTEPIFLDTHLTITPIYQGLQLDFSSGTANDIIYCTLVMDVDNTGTGSDLTVLTATQTQLGLDEDNNAVEETQFGSTYFFSNNTAALTFEGLAGGTYYNSYCVV